MNKPLSWYRRFYSRRLHNLGVGKELSNTLSDRLVHQIQYQGEVEALNYFKRCGDAIVYSITRSGDKPVWVRLRHGIPVIFYELRDAGEEILLRVAKIARSIRFSEITQKQVEKVKTAPILPFNGDSSSVSEMTALIKAGLSLSGLTDVPFTPVGLPRRVVDFKRRTLSLGNHTPEQGSPPILESLEIVSNVPELRNLPGMAEAFWPMHEDSTNRCFTSLVNDKHVFVGSIHATQEGGGKLRMFASPFTVVQCLLYPIHDWISSYNKLLVTNCTFDQMSGALWAQQKLQSDLTVHSVDLSTATCRFPLEPQISMLIELGLPQPYVDALLWACKGDWIVGKELRSSFAIRHMNWVVGQPLGLAPSMSMFSLAHNMLLYAISVSCGANPEDSFRVLGDDVVIVGDEIHRRYTQLIQSCGIPISWSKCHSSDKFAEFAGCSITKRTILRPGQWRTPNVGNLIGIADSLKVPTYGEVTQVGRLIQEAFLFSKGLFTPPPSEWSLMLRISSSIRTLKIFDFKPTQADLKYYRAMTYFQSKLGGAFGVHPFRPVEFVYDTPNLRSSAFRPILKITPEEHLETVMSFRATASHYSDNIAITSMQAYACASWLFDVGVLESDQILSDLLGDVESAINSLLWLDLPKNGLHRRLRRLEQTYARLVRSALQDSTA